MNRKTLIEALVIVGLSACTAQQRQMAANVVGDESPASADTTPAVVAVADPPTIVVGEPLVDATPASSTLPPWTPRVSGYLACDHFAFRVLGFEPGTKVSIEVASEPPYAAEINANGKLVSLPNHTPLDQVSIPLYWQTRAFGVSIDVVTPDGVSSRVFSQEIDC